MRRSIKGLAARDLEEALTVVGTALECNTVDELRCEVLRLLEEVFKTGSSNFFMTTGPNRRIDFERVISRSIEERFLTQFRQYYYLIDPFLKVSYSPQGSTVLTTEQVIPYQDLIQGEYYNDFLRHQSIHHQMTVWLRRGARLMGIVALFRPRNAQAFSPVDHAKARLMAPYLAEAMDRTIMTHKSLVHESVIDTIVSDLPYEGIMVLDDSLEPIYQSDKALSLLCPHGQTGTDRDAFSRSAVFKEIYHCCKRLLACRRVETTPDTQLDQFELASAEDGKKVSIGMRLIRNRGKPLILVYMEPDEHMETLFKRLKGFSLSRRELDVVLLLSKGLKNNEIGKKLFISPHTVDNHLKSIYRKMGVTNRTAATRRILDKVSNNNLFASLPSPHPQGGKRPQPKGHSNDEY
jgi:DNA-binding CsgD family transcriptional regulator